MIRFLVSPRLRARWRKLCLCSKEETKDKKKNWLGRLYNKVISRKKTHFGRCLLALCYSVHVALARRPLSVMWAEARPVWLPNCVGNRTVRTTAAVVARWTRRRQATRRLKTRPECDSLRLPLKTRVVVSAVGADGRGARSHFFVRPRRCLVRPVSTGRASRMQYDHRVPAVFHAGLASVVPSCYLLCCVETERDIFSIHDVMSHKLSPPPVSIIKVSI